MLCIYYNKLMADLFEGEKIVEKCLSIPLCTCGTCVLKRNKKDHFISLPYSSRLGSIYQNDFNWKNPRVFKTDYLKATHSAQENSYRKNINNCLISTSKLSYKPFKVSQEGINMKNVNVESIPFYGSTTYENTYINYGSSRIPKGQIVDEKDFKVAFRGNSNYRTDFLPHSKEDYLKPTKNIYYKPTLKFVGDISNETEVRDNYKPVDLKQPAYFGGDKLNISDLYKSQMIPCPFPKSNFESITKTSFKDHFQEPCKLKEYMKRNNITSIEI
jgi:hypothetical protein